MKVRKSDLKVIIFTIFIYIGLTDCFGLVSFASIFGKGQLYDIAFVLGVLVWLCSNINGRVMLNDEKGKIIVRYMNYIIIYVCISAAVLVLSGKQDLISTLFVIRDFLYVFIYLYYRDSKYDERIIIKTLVLMELVGGGIYMVEMITGPLTPVHINGSYMSFGLYRSYSQVGLFSYFLCPFILVCLQNKSYLFSRKKDICALIYICITVFSKMTRGQMIALMLVCWIGYVFYTGRSTIIHSLKALGVIITLGMCIYLFFPNLFTRLIQGISDVIARDNIGATSFSIRTGTMVNRFVYLIENGSVLWGLGPLHGEYRITSLASSNIYDVANVGIIASDISYGSILIRYGVVGSVIIITTFIRIYLKNLKSNIFYYCLGLTGIGMLIGGFVSHYELCFGGLLRYGIVLGISLKANVVWRKQRV